MADPEWPTITWDIHKLAQFKVARDNAIKAGKDVFSFEGHEVLVSYAKYLIEYLDAYFKRTYQGKGGA